MHLKGMATPTMMRRTGSIAARLGEDQAEAHGVVPVRGLIPEPVGRAGVHGGAEGVEIFEGIVHLRRYCGIKDIP